MIGARRNGFVVAGAGPREVSVIEIQQPKFFVVSRGRIVEDGALQFLNAAATRKKLKRAPQQARIRDDFHQDVDERSHPVKQDDPDPKEVRSPPDEVDDGHDPQQDGPPRKGEEEKRSHREIAL